MKIISNHIVEAIALITAIWNWKYIKNTRYVYFIPFLAFVLLGELGGIYFSSPPHLNAEKNMHIYLTITIVETIFFAYIFYQILQSEKIKQFTFIGSTILVSLMTAWFFFFVDISVLLTNTIGITGFFFSCVSCFYLYEKNITTEKTDENLIRNPDFWFAIGVLIFWVTCTIPFILYFFLSKNKLLIFGVPIYRLFPQIFSVVLYGCFTVAIILSRKNSLPKR